MRRAWQLCRLPVAAAAWVLCLTWVLAMAEADLPPCDLSHLSGLLDAANVAWRAPQPASSSGDTPGSSGSSGSGSGGSDALPRLHLGQCRLRRFTRDEARECLAGKFERGGRWGCCGRQQMQLWQCCPSCNEPNTSVSVAEPAGCSAPCTRCSSNASAPPLHCHRPAPGDGWRLTDALPVPQPHTLAGAGSVAVPHHWNPRAPQPRHRGRVGP